MCSWFRYILLLAVIPALFACTPNLERKGVPIVGGVSIASVHACGNDVMQENLDAFQKMNLDSWLIEIPLVIQPYKGSQSFSYYEGHSLDTLVELLQLHHIPYTLTFDLQNPYEIEPRQFRPDSYLTDMSGILLRTKTYPPDRIVFMGSLLDTVMMDGKFQGFITELKKEFSPFQGELGFAARPDFLLSEAFDWKTPDIIGIVYDSPSDLDYKPHFRKLNTQLSDLLILHQKPALIVQTNLLGNDKLLLFQNQLRFWKPEVNIQGIVLNSMYCGFSLIDTTTYFALGDNDRFHNYIKAYLSR